MDRGKVAKKTIELIMEDVKSNTTLKVLKGSGKGIIIAGG